ncbi:CO(2)-response secreted protease-like [Vicia villosa]|uniref:CO(2)-response secreted protease-like n=1 Tax=Vicia villosa TaxID=3911 RepID=UPI00273AD85F|nr:CO(2)-response secreted protease-like [Vicia villosa]
MRGNPILLILIFYSLFIYLGESSESENDDQVYIVYMGAAASTNGTLRKDHAHLLNTLLARNGNALVHNYIHGFSGFAARMSKNEANWIAEQPGVVSVFPDQTMKLHTTRSWDFLKSLTPIQIDNRPSDSSHSSDIVIGVLDTGIWPESASFSDEGMSPIPSGWKGICMTSTDFNSSSCNRKIIGARYYPDIGGVENTVRDIYGHGTHTASTAAGKVVSGVSYYGFAKGTARGGSPESRLAIYKVCYGTHPECYNSAILAAFDDAINDGVHVLSLSLGPGSKSRPALTNDVIAIGAFHAVERGIMVVCSAGNDGNVGPGDTTVVNDVPWIFTVGATTIDRDFLSNVAMGNKKVIKGRAINLSPLSKSAKYPLITGEAAKATTADLAEARQCHFNSLDKDKVKGKIVLCDGTTDHLSTGYKFLAVKEVGGLGLVHITDIDIAEANIYELLPATTVVTPKDASSILEYLNSTSNPVATILPTISVIDYKPAPMVASFSSRGPSTLSKNILKPDIAAPGVNILAAWTGNDAKGREPPLYNLESGTSMSCPHVSGLAGSIKSKNPTWSASAIRSAIMTSATQFNNMKTPITTDLGSVSTPYDYGAGEITLNRSFRPGLVYETSTIDYLNYLCYMGYNTTTIKVIARTIPDSFSCPKDSNPDHISNINYPSIAISNFIERQIVNVSRTVTNVGEKNEIVYSAIIDAPSSVKVQLIPEKLNFTKNSKKLSYQIIFSYTLIPLKDDLFGSITWKSGDYEVRSPFVLAV